MYETGTRRFHRLEAAAREPGHSRILRLPADAAPVSPVPPLCPGAVCSGVGAAFDYVCRASLGRRCDAVPGHRSILGGLGSSHHIPDVPCTPVAEVFYQTVEENGETLLAMPLLPPALSLLRPGRKDGCTAGKGLLCLPPASSDSLCKNEALPAGDPFGVSVVQTEIF